MMKVKCHKVTPKNRVQEYFDFMYKTDRIIQIYSKTKTYKSIQKFIRDYIYTNILELLSGLDIIRKNNVIEQCNELAEIVLKDCPLHTLYSYYENDDKSEVSQSYSKKK
jgi:hypothetical protein